MLIIPIKDGENIDRALKRFKRKFDKTGTMRQLRQRQTFYETHLVSRRRANSKSGIHPTPYATKKTFNIFL